MKPLPSHSFPSPKSRFDADFIERRMQEHREQMAVKAADDLTEIIKEVGALIMISQKQARTKRLAR